MPKACPPALRRDVVGVPKRWLKEDDVEADREPGTTAPDANELRKRRCGSGCGSRRTRSCSGRRCIWVGTSTQNDVPLSAGPGCRGDRDHAHLPGPRLLQAGIYCWKASPVSQGDRDEAHLINAAYGVHVDDPQFGCWFITDELEREHGIDASENRVQRLCSQQRITARIGRRKGPGMRPGPAAHDDLVERDFTASALNAKWLTDITEHPIREGRLHLCAVKDGCSHRIVGYAIDAKMTSELATNALRMAITLRGRPSQVIGHSGRGTQFRSRRFVMMLRGSSLRGSMGRVASSADNAAMEFFLALLKKNVLDRKTWDTREELRIAIIHWIERTDHRRGPQRSLGKLNPIELETIYPQTATAA